MAATSATHRDLLTARETATRYRRSQTTVLKDIESGRLRATRTGAAAPWRIDPDSADRLYGPPVIAGPSELRTHADVEAIVTQIIVTLPERLDRIDELLERLAPSGTDAGDGQGARPSTDENRPAEHPVPASRRSFLHRLVTFLRRLIGRVAL